jgi:hypothetical protein
MKKTITILLALSFFLAVWTSARTHSSSAEDQDVGLEAHGKFARVSSTLSGSVINPLATTNGSVNAPGNIAEGTYTIVGWASHRCLEIPASSCASGLPLQTYECDRTEKTNNQKFNVISDGAGNYTISPAHSDLCLEVPAELSDRAAVLQNACVPGKVSQKWAMNQAGDNLEIRDIQNNQCMDVWNKLKTDYTPVVMQRCNNGTNQRWTLHKTTLNNDTGIICKASPSHPEHDCSGVNDQQKEVRLGKTLTKARCDEACQATKMVSCKWSEQ